MKEKNVRKVGINNVVWDKAVNMPFGGINSVVLDMVKFVTRFGTLWVVFTAVTAIVLGMTSGERVAMDQWVAFAVSLFYVGRVFYWFRSDLNKKMADPNYKLIGDKKRFLIDVALGVGLLVYEFGGLVSDPESYSAIKFNNVSASLLGLIFSFFKMVIDFGKFVEPLSTVMVGGGGTKKKSIEAADKYGKWIRVFIWVVTIIIVFGVLYGLRGRFVVSKDL